MKPSNRYDSLFRYYSESLGLDWIALKAQGLAESQLDPDVSSPVGAKGVMQFMLPTWKDVFGVDARDDRENPEKSIQAGAIYMGRLLKTFNDFHTALAAYNWGWGNVRKHVARHGKLVIAELPRETREYIIRIEGHRSRLLSESVG